MFTISTAGEAHERETSILGRLVDANERAGVLETQPGLTVSRNEEARVLVYNYSAPTDDPHDIAAMKLANPASWISEQYLARQAENPELTAGEVLQLHGCVWAPGQGAWITPEQWDACYDPEAQPVDGQDLYLGVDIGLVDDCSSVAAAWRMPDGRIGVEAHTWAARRDVEADLFVEGGVIDLELVEENVRELCRRFRVTVVYDPRFFERSAQLLEREGIETAPLFQNTGAMAGFLELWHQRVLEGKVAHAGGRVLRAHVLNTVAERGDRGWKVSKLKHHRKIDANIAAVMAHGVATANQPSAYLERGVLAV